MGDVCGDKGAAFQQCQVYFADLQGIDFEVCSECKATLHYAEERCPRCHHAVDPPNRRKAMRVHELEALNTRYASAMAMARSNGLSCIADMFQKRVKHSRAIINVTITFLSQFISQFDALYSSYNSLTTAKVRKLAQEIHHRMRTEVEAKLFPGYGNKIIYAAVYLDGKGLYSYGAYGMLVHQLVLEKRASVLEENSFTMIERLKPGPGMDIPPGHRAIWQYRDLLAVAKLTPSMSATLTEEQFTQLLLKCDGDRHTDEFMEVHIFGELDLQCFDGIVAPTRIGQDDMRLHMKIRDLAGYLRYDWVEYDG